MVSGGDGVILRKVEALIGHFEPMIEPIKTFAWEGPDREQFWEFLRRSVVVRQMQALRAALMMAKAGQGAFGVTFLRPAYEELLWVEYLTAHETVAGELVRLLGAHEIAASLDAQNQFIGTKGMLNVGFTQSFVKRRLAATRESDARLREIGRELGWRDGQTSPSMAFVARKTGREKEYNFIYHATSRFVHFSTVETFRRVWGKSGQVTISSENFSRYWTDFSLYWGFRIFVETASSAGILDFVDGQADNRTGEDILEMIDGLHPIEIVTAAELESWPSRREYENKK